MVYFKLLLLFLFVYIKAEPKGPGSGQDGKLRLCLVEGRGAYKRTSKFCPVLDHSDCGVECVIGRDRLDCLRRMSKGDVDFGVFSPEDLIATQWANIAVLVTDELRAKPRSYATSIVAVVNRNLLPDLDSPSSAQAALRGSTLCHVGLGADDRRPLSDTLTEYLTTLVTKRSCNSSLSVEENRIKAIAGFFKGACRAGPWVLDAARDAELKAQYSSLCAACSGECSVRDRYWGPAGALACLSEGAGTVTFAEADNVARYFGEQNTTAYADPSEFAYLCRDGSWQGITGNAEPCAWLRRPWPLLVAKTKVAAAVSNLAANLTQASALVAGGWRGALSALLQLNSALPAPLQPPAAPLDYLATAQGLREAYSQNGCQASRHITLCTTSILEQNKCEWLSEAAAVYGVEPPLQCARQPGAAACLRAVGAGACDLAVAGADWLVPAMRDMSLTPVLHESTNILNQSTTVVAYVREDSNINKMADLRGKRAVFPRFDGIAWHSVLRYLANVEKSTCKDILSGFFSSVCAPGVEKNDLSENLKKKWTENCYVQDGNVLDGEQQALRLLVEGKSDVAFLSMNTYNQYMAHQIPELWNADVKIKPLCAEESAKYCFISWSNIGHVFAKNTSAMRVQEIINVFTKYDQLFGKHFPFHTAMFSLYGPYNHQNNVIFDDNTKMLATRDIFKTHPYDKFPMNFESSLKSIDSCHLSDLTGFGVRTAPTFVVLLSLVLVLFS
ncbi:transferrin-like [Choristoneura fumiferana]|uniref:transferrin-like n=1 Tax=Choristoneura fumiferana TaxID=7141 RepID=UPI003D15BD00